MERKQALAKRKKEKMLKQTRAKQGIKHLQGAVTALGITKFMVSFIKCDRLCRAPEVRGGTFSVLVRELKKCLQIKCRWTFQRVLAARQPPALKAKVKRSRPLSNTSQIGAALVPL